MSYKNKILQYNNYLQCKKCNHRFLNHNPNKNLKTLAFPQKEK